MSLVVRIAVVFLLLSAVSCFAGAAEGGDPDHGHDSGEASVSGHAAGDSSGGGDSGKDSGGNEGDSSPAGDPGSPGDGDGRNAGESSGSVHATGDSAGRGDSGRDSGGEGEHDSGGESSGSGTDAPATPEPGKGDNAYSGPGADSTAGEDSVRDSRESRDYEVKTADRERDTGHADNRETPGHMDRSDPRGTASSREGTGSIEADESDRDSPGSPEKAGQETSRGTSHTVPYEEKDHQDDGEEQRTRDAHDRKAERPDRENPDTAAQADPDPRGTGEIMTGEPGEPDSLPFSTGSFSLLPGGNDGEGFPEDEPYDATPFARDQPATRQTGPDAGQRPAPPLPAQVPNGEVPFASTPALPASGLPLSSPSGTPAGTSTPVRSKVKGEHEPFWEPTDSALVLSPWMLAKLWCFFGFRRVLRKNVLESDERRSLYESITMHPGVDLAKLTDMLRLNKETARYHLKMLAANGKISGLIKQGIARYFPCREMISEFEKTVIHYLWIGTTKQILLLLIRTPGLTRQAIAQELGIAGPSVTWQMQRLADDGLVEIRAEGRFVRYFLTPVSVDVLESVQKSDGRAGPSF